MDRAYYEEFRIVNENLRTGLRSRPARCAARRTLLAVVLNHR